MFIRLVEYERKYLSWLIEAGIRVGIYMNTDDGLFYTTVDPERQKCAFIIKPKKK